MADSNPTPGGEQQYFNAGVTYRPDIQRGSNNDYGYALVSDGSQTSQDSIRVVSGTTVSFTARPDTATGFKFKGWLNPNTSTVLRDAINPYSISISGDTYLAPIFEPNNPTYRRKISVAVQGLSTSRLVTVRSMNGYYEYALNGGTSTAFNNEGSGNQLPDGRTISVYALVVPGYDVTITANGNPQPIVPMVDYNTEVQESGRGTTGTRGASEQGSSNYGSQSPTYEMATILNPSSSTASPLAIVVTYTEQAVMKHIEAAYDPRDGGSVAINYWPDGPGGRVVTGTSLDVPSGSTVQLVATPAASYNFTQWSSNLGGTSSSSTTTTTVNEDVRWTARFNQAYNTITVKPSPTNGGSVQILVNGSAIPGTAIAENQVGSGDRITILATPNTNYNFSHWYEESNPTVKYEGTETPVEFGDYNLVYTAVFDYVPSGSVLYKSYTTAVYGGEPHVQDGADGVVFKATYERPSGGQTYKTVGAQVQDLDILLQTDSGGLYSTVKLEQNGPYTVVEGRHTYRYTSAGFKYSETYVSGDTQADVWEDCVLDAQGNWKRYYNNQQSRIPTGTLSAFFTKEEIFTVALRSYTPSRPNGNSEIVISGDGEYSYGDSCTATAALATGVDPNRYQFAYWADASDLETPVSDSASYTFTVESSQNLVAVFREFTYVEYSANDIDLGSVTSEVTNDTWVEYGTEFDVTATPASGASLLRWKINGSPAGSSSTIRIILNSPAESLGIVAEFIGSSNTLTVRAGSGGSVQVELKDPDGIYSYASPDDGNVDQYTVPSGYGVRVTAVPNPRYSFSSFTLFDSSSEIVQTSTNHVIELAELTENMTLAADFSHVPWISTLGAIIKVF